MRMGRLPKSHDFMDGHTIKVVGIDPSMRNWGLALVTYIYHPPGDILEYAIGPGEAALELIQSGADYAKKSLKSVTDIKTASTIFTRTMEFIKDADVVVVEAPTGSQGATAAKGIGLVIGVLGALSEASGKPFVYYTPVQVKKAVTGVKDASKRLMMDAMHNQFAWHPWPTKKVKGETSLISGQAEHLADALGAIHTWRNSKECEQHLAAINLII